MSGKVRENLSLDYVLPIVGTQLVVESGVLFTGKEVLNERRWEQTISESTNDQYRFEEENLAFYLLLKQHWKKLKLQLGLRYEDFSSESRFANSSNSIHRNFQNFFPSLHINYNFTENQGLNFGYNRRTSRPKFWQINPYTNAFDPFYNQQGNPALNPEFSHNVEMNYTHTQEIWSFNRF